MLLWLDSQSLLIKLFHFPNENKGKKYTVMNTMIWEGYYIEDNWRTTTSLCILIWNTRGKTWLTFQPWKLIRRKKYWEGSCDKQGRNEMCLFPTSLTSVFLFTWTIIATTNEYTCFNTARFPSPSPLIHRKCSSNMINKRALQRHRIKVHDVAYVLTT